MRVLRKAIGRHKCENGVKISPRASKIPRLRFANDNLLVCKTALESYRELRSILNTLC